MNVHTMPYTSRFVTLGNKSYKFLPLVLLIGELTPIRWFVNARGMLTFGLCWQERGRDYQGGAHDQKNDEREEPDPC